MAHQIENSKEKLKIKSFSKSLINLFMGIVTIIFSNYNFILLSLGILMVYMGFGLIIIDIYYHITQFKKTKRKIAKGPLIAALLIPAIFSISFVCIVFSNIRELLIIGYYLLFVGFVLSSGIVIDSYYVKKRISI